MKLTTTTRFARNCRLAAVIAIGGSMSLMLSLPAAATDEYAKQTGEACAACHQSAKGGGALTPEGTRFKAAEKTPPKAAH